MSGALSGLGLLVLEARITTEGSSAVNTFVVQDASGSKVIDQHRQDFIEQRLQQRFCGEQGINGGVLNGVTLGANWFLNPNTRVALNYDFTYRDFTNSLGANGSGGINGFGTRFFYDF